MSIQEIIDEFKNLRINSGLTQTQVAKLMNTCQAHISNFEAGRYNPGLYFLYRYAKVCNKTMHITFEDRED